MHGNTNIEKDVVCDFVVGSNRREVHCIVSVGTGTDILFLLSRRHLVSRCGVLVSTGDSHFQHTRFLSQPKYMQSCRRFFIVFCCGFTISAHHRT
jgi:hypothetical protein